MNDYFIPANSKKSKLILSYFTPFDLILFGSGIGITLFLLLILDDVSFLIMVLILLPTIITGFLVLPIPNYHNVLQFIVNIYSFCSEQRRYLWKGWSCNGKDE